MLVETLLAHARNSPRQLAVHDDAGDVNYEQLAALTLGVARFLSTQTQRPNVGLMLPSGAGFVASFYGTLLAGKCVVPINFLLGQREVAHVIKDSDVDTVLTIPQLAAKVEQGAKAVDLAQLQKSMQSPPPPVSAPPGEIPIPRKSPDDLAVLMYTSGTSGLPKGVELTYGNLQSDVDACIEHAQLQREHRFLGVIPLFHAFGMTAMMIAPIQLGAPIIYMARFSPVAAINAIRQHAVSLVFAVPSMYGAIAHLKNASGDDFKTIYGLFSGGEPLSAALRESFQQRFGLPLYEGYGLTETSPVISLNWPKSHRPGSVGRTVPGVSLKIVDDDGQPVPGGQSGEVWLAGPMIMKGYHNLPSETAAALTEDRYFKTGDLGKIDEDGFLYITGRKKDLIIVAGEKASPREIEDALGAHPAVAEVAVVGKKDPGRGEIVVAFVVAKTGQELKLDDLRETCRRHGLPQWKIPREIFLRDELPHSPTGKVLKRVLAEQANQAS
jgi:long-chain acyl-CoA synthetase